MDFIYSFEVQFSHGTETNKQKTPVHNLHSNNFQRTFAFQIKLPNLSHGFGIQEFEV